MEDQNNKKSKKFQGKVKEINNWPWMWLNIGTGYSTMVEKRQLTEIVQPMILSYFKTAEVQKT